MIVGGLEAALGIMTHPILFNRKANLYVLAIDKDKFIYRKKVAILLDCLFLLASISLHILLPCEAQLQICDKEKQNLPPCLWLHQALI